MVVSAHTQTITVEGNVEGGIVLGDHNFVVNTNYGTIVYQQAVPPRLRSVTPKPPRRALNVVGRARELTDLERLIHDRQAAFLCGIDGLGKTTLVRQVAHGEAARACPDGVIYLEGIDEKGATLGVDDIRQLLFNALYESVPPLKVDAGSAPGYLGNTEPLVLLDHFALSPAALGSLADLFPQGAVLMACPQPSCPDTMRLLKLGPLSRSESIELFAANMGQAVEDLTHATLDALCAALGDVPSALVWVAKAISTRNVALEKAHQIITTAKPSSTDPLQAGIDRANAFVFSLLSANERQMLALAAGMPGASADRAWLENAAGGPTVSNALQAFGLLQANSPRLTVPPSLRAAALDPINGAAAKEQLIGHLRETLTTRSLEFDWLADELGNILGLHEWAFSKQRWGDVIAIGRAVDPYLTLRGLWDAWRTVLDRVLLAARAVGDRLAEAWALHQLGTREIGTGEKVQAVALLKQALALRQLIGDNAGAAYTQHNLNLLLPPPPPPDKPPEPPQPVPGPAAGTPGWLWGIIAFLATGVVMLGVVGAVVALLLQPTPTPPSASLIAPELTFFADPMFIDPGECAVLQWTVQRADWVQLNGKEVAFSDRSQDCPNETTTYSLMAAGGTGARKDIQIVVRTPTPAPSAMPSETSTPSATPSQTRASTGTPRPSITPSRTRTRTRTPTSTKTSTATKTWTPTPTKTWTTCPTPVIPFFNASQPTINLGQKSTLSWGFVQFADSVTIDQGIGGVATPGQATVSPKTTTTYVLTAVGCGGAATKQVTVVVQADTSGPRITWLRTTPNPIEKLECLVSPFTVEATVTDPSGVGSVNVFYRTRMGSTPRSWQPPKSMAGENWDIYKVTIDASQLSFDYASPGTHWFDFYIEAFDALNNKSTSATVSVEVIDSPC